MAKIILSFLDIPYNVAHLKFSLLLEFSLESSGDKGI